MRASQTSVASVFGGSPPGASGLLWDLQRSVGNRLTCQAIAQRSASKTEVRIQEIAPRSSLATDIPPAYLAPLAKTGQEKVGPSPFSVGLLGTSYGTTLPEEIAPTIKAKKTGTDWESDVTDVVGRYSIRARILGHQADVPNTLLRRKPTSKRSSRRSMPTAFPATLTSGTR